MQDPSRRLREGLVESFKFHITFIPSFEVLKFPVAETPDRFPSKF